MTWIVTGGAGFIGAHVVHLLRRQHFRLLQPQRLRRHVSFCDLMRLLQRQRLPHRLPMLHLQHLVSCDLQLQLHLRLLQPHLQRRLRLPVSSFGQRRLQHLRLTMKL